MKHSELCDGQGRLFCLQSWRIILMAIGLVLISGCASPHNPFLANDPLTAVFTKAEIPRSPTPTDPSRSYEANPTLMWSAVNRAIQDQHGVIISSSQDAGIVTYYIDCAPLFEPKQIKEPKNFVKTLADGTDPPAALIWSRFNSAVRTRLQPELLSTDDFNTGVRLLVEQLNDVVCGPSLFDEKLFSKVSLQKQTRQLISAPSSPDATSHINRLLLEDAFPQYIERTLLFNIRPAFTRYYTTVLLVQRNMAAGTTAYVTTWKNGINPPESNLSEAFYSTLAKEVNP